MTYFAYVIEVITRTGGIVFDIYRVEAATGAEAVAFLVEQRAVPENHVYLISEQEANEWAALQIPIRQL